MKKIILTLIITLLCINLALASSISRSFSSTTVEHGETLDIILTVNVDGDDFYAIDEILPSTSWAIVADGGGDNQQAGHLKWVVVSGATSTTYQYSLTVPNEPGEHIFSGTYGFELNPIQDILGDDLITISTPAECSEESECGIDYYSSNYCYNGNVVKDLHDFSCVSESCEEDILIEDVELCDYGCSDGICEEEPQEEVEDDLMVNYVRGQIIIEGEFALEERDYSLEILSGENIGYIYNGEVDLNIPSGLKGNGYFDTQDNIEFNTGDGFIITVEGYECSEEGIFENGGNGDFNTPESLIVVECNIENYPPILDFIGDKNINENELLEFEVNAEDADLDVLEYIVNNLPIGSSFVNKIFSWIPGYNQAGEYEIEFIASDGISEDIESITITVNNINRAPLLDKIEEIILEENELRTININAIDEDGEVLTYIVIDENIEKVDCDFNGEELTMTPAFNWNGHTFCVIEVSDGDLTDQETIEIQVNPINEEPIFTGQILDLSWDEGTQLINHINLNDYFSDPDGDILEYGVIGNYFIEISISNGLVSFDHQDNWADEENIVFSASDSEFITYSNAINLIVNDINDAPEFLDLNCDIEILEDEFYDCIVEAEDFEEDEFEFSVVEETNLECSFENNVLDYNSEQDYYGDASCLLRVSDDYGYSEYLFEVDIENVNDGPEIISFNPNSNVIRLLKGGTQLFEIIAEDIDSEINFFWFLNDEELGNGNSYLFEEIIDEEFKEYELKCIASDGETDKDKNQIWDIFVGDSSYFTCSEVGGYECTENEICLEEYLDVNNSLTCCPVACSEKPPEFSDIRNRKEITGGIAIEIKNPSEDEEFELGETIDTKLRIWNNLDEELDFNVEAYLYDLTEDEIVEEIEEEIEVSELSRKYLNLDIEIPNDIDEGNKYAIFVRIEDEDEIYYDEEYVEIEINRKEHEIVIESIEINPLNLDCGENIFVKIKIKNLGTEDEDVYLKIENSDLGINEKTEVFELEEYDEKDFIVKEFILDILEGIEEKNYDLRFSVVSDYETIYETRTINIEECKIKDIKSEDIETIILEGPKSPIKSLIPEKIENQSRKILYLIVFLGTAVVLLVFLISILKIFYLM